MKSKQDVIEFKLHLERLGFSRNMVSQLPAHVRDFISYINKDDVRLLTAQDVELFYKHLQQRPNKRRAGGLSENYINHHVYALKLFFSFQQERGSLVINPMSGLSFPRPNSKPRDVLTIHEIEVLYEACRSFKDRAILGVFYGGGLRRSEAEKLDIKDIHFRSGLLYVREGKRKRRRVVPMPEKVIGHIKSYVYEERKSKKGEQALITNQLGARMRGEDFARTLKVLLGRANIKKQITLHSLRHTIATHLLASGLSVEYVRDFLGHKHLETTQIYTKIHQSQLNKL